MFLYRFQYRDSMAYDLTDLELFLQVVDQGSITQGAERAHLSLASASARITAMEKALGAKLLDRHRRGVVPSPTGWLLWPEVAVEHEANLSSLVLNGGHRDGC
jgi:hypothetical protein